jgi:hypothetical protein
MALLSDVSGRFGPQQTLFMPGCWLKEGENEIIVLDLKGPEKASIRGLKKPILDWLRNEVGFYPSQRG